MTEPWADWVHRTDHTEGLDEAESIWPGVVGLLLMAVSVVPLLLLWALGAACWRVAKGPRCW